MDRKIDQRNCRPGRAMHNRTSSDPNHFVSTVFIESVRVQLNTSFRTPLEADDYARQFAKKWNRAEEIRLPRTAEAGKLNFVGIILITIFALIMIGCMALTLDASTGGAISAILTGLGR